MGNAPDSIEADGKPTEVKKKLPVKRCSMGSLNMITGKNNGVYSKSTESEGTSEGDDANSQSVMEENFVRKNCEEVEEYVFLDLDAVVGLVDLPPNAPYVLSGLDTLNPILTIDDKWKLVGEYEETIGTCLIFSENDVAPVVHEETGPVDANLFTGVCIIDPNLPPVKQVTSIARLQKILKFRLLEEDDVQDATAEPPIAIVSMDTPPAKSDVQS